MPASSLCLYARSIFVWLRQGPSTVPIGTPSPRQPVIQPPAPSTAVFTPTSVYKKEQIASVIRIQRYYHAQKALASIKFIQAQYDSLRGRFVFPTTLDFEDDDRFTSNDSLNRQPELSQPDGPYQSPKSTYTHTHPPLHQYAESLSLLLVLLHAVDSRGVERVQEKRRAAVRQVEEEVRSLERRVAAVWDSQHQDVSNSPESSETSLTSSPDDPSSMADGSSSPPSSAQLSTDVMGVKASEDLPADALSADASGDHPMKDAPPIYPGAASCFDGDTDLSDTITILANNPSSPKAENASTSPISDPKVTALPGDVRAHLPSETMVLASEMGVM
jgi:hypothetical protein